MIAGRLADKPHGGAMFSNKNDPQTCELKSEAQAAQAMNVKARAVSAAKAVLHDRAAEVVRGADLGKLSETGAHTAKSHRQACRSLGFAWLARHGEVNDV